MTDGGWADTNGPLVYSRRVNESFMQAEGVVAVKDWKSLYADLAGDLREGEIVSIERAPFVRLLLLVAVEQALGTAGIASDH